MTMRFMVISRATATSEAGTPPKTEDFAATIAFNEELVKAGILLAADGLKPSSAGTRVRMRVVLMPTYSTVPAFVSITIKSPTSNGLSKKITR